MSFYELVVIKSELFLTGCAFVLLMAGVFQRDRGGQGYLKYYKLSTIIFLLGLALLLTIVDVGKTVVLGGMVIHDWFAVFVKMIILISAACIMVISMPFAQGKGRLPAEFPFLIMISAVGMMLMVSSNNLISLYMSLEMQSLPLYVLAAIKRDKDRSGEAGLKYFMLGALSSGMLLFGSSLIYGFIGATGFSQIAEYIAGSTGNISPGVMVGMILVLIGIGFKISAVPFHMWTPDVYEGAPKPVVAFFATAPKVAAIALLLRFLNQPFGDASFDWKQIVIFFALASMIVGSFGALRQTNIKRLMAYSSIGHVGFIMVGLASGSIEGLSAILLYLVIYVAMNIGVFSFIATMRRNNAHIEDISSLAGLSSYRPLTAMAVTILMFSMAGVPPFAGFFGKFYVFMSAVDAGLHVLAVVGVLTSVVAAFYYIRIIKIMYFDELGDEFDSDVMKSTVTIMGIMAVFNMIFFVYPHHLLEIIRIVAGSLLQ